MKSIRSFLLSRLLCGAALVLAAAGLAIYALIARSLERQFDRNLAVRIQGFASILFQVEDHVEFEFSGELMPEYEGGERPAYFELWFQDGRLLERSTTLGEGDLALRGTPSREPLHWTAPLPDGRPGRFVAQLIEVHHVYPEEGPNRPTAAQILVAVARGREELAAAERTVLAYCVGTCLVLMLLIALLSWTAVKRGLEPASRLAKALDAIQVDHLPEELSVGDVPLELGPMASTTNALIQRVEKALERERRTTADIAHELRTPISELLTVSEVALRNGRDPDGARRALGTVRDVAGRMGRSVSTLLKLARLEQGTEATSRARVDLDGIVRESLRSLSGIERDRELRVESLVEAGERVDGDADVLRIAVSNLLSNALYYSPRGGRVTCSLARPDGGWRLVVENDAPDLRPEDLPMLSEPFWRKDRARVDRNRSGLGLALSKALVERVGMEMGFELEHGVFRASLIQHEEARGSNGRNGAPAA